MQGERALKIYISKPSILTGVGDIKALLNASLSNKNSLSKKEFLNKEFMVSTIKESLEKIPPNFSSYLYSRTDEIAFNAILGLKDEIQRAIKRHGRENVAVVTATTTSGIEENFKIFKNGTFDKDKFQVEKNEFSNPSELIKEFLSLIHI